MRTHVWKIIEITTYNHKILVYPRDLNFFLLSSCESYQLQLNPRKISTKGDKKGCVQLCVCARLMVFLIKLYQTYNLLVYTQRFNIPYAWNCWKVFFLLFSFQYNQEFRSRQLGNWEVPKSYPLRPDTRKGCTTVIANDRGHLLPCVKR